MKKITIYLIFTFSLVVHGCNTKECTIVAHIQKVCDQMPLIRRVNDYTEKGPCRIDLTQLDSFQWDKMYQIHGPTFPQQIKEAINVNYRNSVDDGFIKLIFTNDKKVTCEVEYESSSYSNSTVSIQQIINDPKNFPVIKKSQSVFSVTCERLDKDCKNCCLYVMRQVSTDSPIPSGN